MPCTSSGARRSWSRRGRSCCLWWSVSSRVSIVSEPMQGMAGQPGDVGIRSQPTTQLAPMGQPTTKLTCRHDQQPPRDVPVAVQHPQDAGRKKETLVVRVCRHDEQVLCAEQLGRQDSGVAADQVGHGPLQHEGDQKRKQCGSTEPAPCPARDGHPAELQGLRHRNGHARAEAGTVGCRVWVGRTEGWMGEGRESRRVPIQEGGRQTDKLETEAQPKERVRVCVAARVRRLFLL